VQAEQERRVAREPVELGDHQRGVAQAAQRKRLAAARQRRDCGRLLTTAADAAAEQLLVDAVGLLFHATVLGSGATAGDVPVIERRRRNSPLFHPIELRVAWYLDLSLREDESRFRAGRCDSRTEQRKGR